MKFTARYPPSVNSLYGVRAMVQKDVLFRVLGAVKAGKMTTFEAAKHIQRAAVAFPYKTKEHADYVEAIRPTEEQWRKPAQLGVTIRLFRPRRIGDVDGPIKALLDCMQGRVYENDSQISELHVYRGDDKDNPRVEVDVTQLLVPGEQFDLTDPEPTRPGAVITERPVLTMKQLAAKARPSVVRNRSTNPQSEE